ncbi:glycogen synthase GlgA [Halorhodospira halochloris]|uniref:glycogen synthase GlgA n=1 Tax=Halorhodospira halochloris TaxID=1052 RepID=UPI001EE97371|nr:glycogen synthase GlgA [Halorhodospira halochloris]MCG5531408.1 glycogen synthase GlgA [Halorhodospira halochloris]
MKILFVTAEAWPLAKTGGLGDVAYGLTCALADRGHDVRLLMPAYPSARERLEGPIKYLSLGSGAGSVKGQAQTSSTKGQAQSSNRYHKQKIIEGRLPGSEVSVWLLDDPELFERVGSPYATASGEPWPDNHLRFYWLSRVAAAIAAGEVLDWQADILHANDWQSALAPVFLQDYSESHQERPRTVFSIHNLAYRGIFSADVFAQLELPAAMWNPERLEFYGELAFIKGALTLSDAITTVSPTYAREIQTPAFGWGLDGLLRSRSSDLHGIINGVDTTTWDPATDPHLAANYSAPDPQAKAKNRQAIAVEIGLDDDPQSPLLGFIGRLVEQKGIDLILGALPRLLASGARLAILGSGDNTLERALLQAAQAHPGRVGVSIGYDEGQAHRIEAGSDIFLMPSRFEPCGLNQLYSLRYGTPPLVNPTGGLADTVLDVDAHAGGNGFCTAAADAGSLAATVERALSYWQDQEAWQKIQARGMSADYSWDRSADAYVDLYERIRATGWQRR